jgi:hypothetical protein
MTENTTPADAFCSAALPMQHPVLGRIVPGWNRGFDPLKLAQVFDAQREPGVANYLHREPVPCRRDSDGFVWSDMAGDFVDPSTSAVPKSSSTSKSAERRLAVLKESDPEKEQ